MNHEPPRPLRTSDTTRRAFLAAVEDDLARRRITGLRWDYRALPPHTRPIDLPITTLVATADGVPGDIRVGAAVRTRRVVSTLPGGGTRGAPAAASPAVEHVGALARQMGIGAVIGTTVAYEPFPGDGTPEYEVVIREPTGATSAPVGPATASDDASMPLAVRRTADPTVAAEMIVAWARRRRPKPRTVKGDRRQEALRAVARARLASVAGIDREAVARLRAAARLAEAWQAAGIDVAFDPLDPGAGIDDALAPPIPSAPSVTARMERMMASSGMGAIIDVGVMAAMVERMLGSLPASPQPPPPVAPSLTAEARVALREDLAALDPVQLLWNLPRDERGRLAQGECALLAGYDSVAPHGKGRRIWLAAALPGRRRDPQRPTLRLASLIGANHRWRWDEMRWLWDERATGAGEDVRWGIARLPLGDVGAGAWRDGLAEPFERDGASEAARAARGLMLQDAGRYEEALALYGVELGPAVAQVVRGEPLGSHVREPAEPWADAVREALWGMALWRLRPLLLTAAEERARWLAEKRGRKRPLPALRLLRLPKQTEQSNAVLTLAAREPDGGKPWLTLEWTASNERLPLAAWRREVDVDLLRFGMLARHALPYG